MKCKWNFRLKYIEDLSDPRPAPHWYGVELNSFEDFCYFMGILDLPYKSFRDGKIARADISIDEKSNCLKRFLSELESKYGFVPAQSGFISKADEGRVFKLGKVRDYALRELDEFDYLSLDSSEKRIADLESRTKKDILNETYVVKRHKKKKTIQLGFLMPSQNIAITGELKSHLKQFKLKGLKTEVVINSDDLWKLTSDIVLPQSELKLYDASTRSAVELKDEWTKFSDRHLDDDGYGSIEFKYKRSIFEAIAPFDIAITAELRGVSINLAFRTCIISQRFRQILLDRGVKGITYAPVRLID